MFHPGLLPTNQHAPLLLTSPPAHPPKPSPHELMQARVMLRMKENRLQREMEGPDTKMFAWAEGAGCYASLGQCKSM